MVLMMGAMFLMTRSAKKKQQQAAEMRNKMEPGSGVRTIGGMYALVKSVNDETVELEVAPGVHAIYSKQAIAVVMDPVEYNRLVHGDEPEDEAVEDADATSEPVAQAVVDAAEAETKDAAEDKDEPVALSKNLDGDKEASAK
jgi:preprotein translocase subunit YajC